METGLLIAALEMSYTTSFKHTARVKYNVDFTNSNINDIIVKLHQLKDNMLSDEINNVHVGYEIIIQDVEHILNIITALLNRYKELFKNVQPKKLYTLFSHLKDADKQTPKQIAKDVLKDILTPEQKKLTHKEQLQVKAEAKSKQRLIDIIKKSNAKKDK